MQHSFAIDVIANVKDKWKSHFTEQIIQWQGKTAAVSDVLETLKSDVVIFRMGEDDDRLRTT